MWHFQNLYLFFIASLLLNLTPGNDMIYVASRSVSQGIKAGIVSAAGIFVGCFVHILAAVLGLSIIISSSAYLFQLIKFAGAAYLVYLGTKAVLSNANNKIIAPKTTVVSHFKLFKQGIITNALNPKVAIFFLSFLPQFIDQSSSFYKLQLFTLGLWFDVQGSLVLVIVAVTFGITKNFFENNPKIWKVQEKITGGILIALGIKIALITKK